MCKKILSVLLIFMFVFCIPIKGNAASPEIEYLPNGNYIITIIEDQPASDSSFISSTVTKTKTSYCYSANNQKLWSVSVTGTFTYGNGSATCISASCKATSYDSSWSVGNKKASKSGNKAIAKATGEQYGGGHIIQTITRTVTLTCSPTGQFS